MLVRCGTIGGFTRLFAVGTMIETNSAMLAPSPDLLRGATLFLDFDGTLVEIAATPDAVIVEARLNRLLARLSRALDGRLAIVSGRPVAQIAGFFPDLMLNLSGSHGMELQRAGAPLEAPAPPGWITDAAAAAADLRRRWPGIVVERKPFGIALHYRGQPEAEAACRALADAIAGDVRHLQPGKMVMEVREPGGGKGDAVRAFMAGPDMAGTRPLFIGDDLTDEPAFRAAADLGGAGILVGAPRTSDATYRLDDVTATIAWLEAAAGDMTA